MDGWMNGWMFGWMDGWTDDRTDGWTSRQSDRQSDICVNGGMDGLIDSWLLWCGWGGCMCWMCVFIALNAMFSAKMLLYTVQQKSCGLIFLTSCWGSDVTYSYHHNSIHFTLPIFLPLWRFSVFHSIQSITCHIQGVAGGTDQTLGECFLGQTIPI